MTAKRTDSFNFGKQDVPKPPVPVKPMQMRTPEENAATTADFNKQSTVEQIKQTFPLVNSAKNVVVETAKSAGRLGQSALYGHVPGVKDPYAQPGGGTSWGQMAGDATLMVPWGRVAKGVTSPVVKLAKPIVSKLGDFTKYTKAIVPETSFGVHTGDVAAAGAGEKLPFSQGAARTAAGWAMGLTAGLGAFAGGVTAGAGRAASPAVVKMISPGAVEKATVENLSKIAGSASVKDAEKAAVKEVFENAPTKPLKDLPDAAGKTAKDTNVNPGLTNLAPNVAVNTITQGTRQQQATSQDKGPTDKGKQKPKEKPKEKPKIRKPVVFDESGLTGQTATIPQVK